MKIIKYLLWIILLSLFGILIYQNLEYFMAANSLRFDLKIGSLNWITPELQNIVYLGISFALGLILAGIKWISAILHFKKQIKAKNAAIAMFKKSRLQRRDRDIEL